MIKKLQAAVILILLAIVGNGVYNYLKTDRDVVFVGVDGYSAPFSITNPSGELKGFDIESFYGLKLQSRLVYTGPVTLVDGKDIS